MFPDTEVSLSSFFSFSLPVIKYSDVFLTQIWSYQFMVKTLQGILIYIKTFSTDIMSKMLNITSPLVIWHLHNLYNFLSYYFFIFIFLVSKVIPFILLSQNI